MAGSAQAYTWFAIDASQLHIASGKVTSATITYTMMSTHEKSEPRPRGGVNWIKSS